MSGWKVGFFSLDKAKGAPMFTKMAEDNDTSIESGATTGAINPPDLSSALKPRRRAVKDVTQPRRRAVKDVTQARNITRSLEQARREQNIKNARIMSKYNADRPYTQSQLDADGLGWKSNFTTKPLPLLVDKVAPRFVKLLEGMKYLTNSKMPETVENASEKTEAFRREITTTIRTRPGCSDLISDIAMENALFGYTAVAWLDEFHWFPKHFRQDSFFVPTGTKQLATSAQVCALRETFLVHELFSLIEDKEAAIAAGWNVQNTVAVLNAAMPEDRRSTQQNWERVYEDLIRESNAGLSHEAGALTVTVWHLLATEISGKVSHMIFTDNESPKQEDGQKPLTGVGLLFDREDQFKDMADALSFFSFQHGNGKLHGSKGIGREIYGMAAMLDRARNEVVDRLNLSGKIIIQGDAKAIKKFKMSVIGNVLLIDDNFNVVERKIDAGVEPFLALDQFLTQHLDQMAGATTPKAFEGERVTKAAVELFASREEESRDNISGRFLNQFATMMTTMQRRLCDSETSEKDAKEMQERLLEIMSREELTLISKQAVAETVRDFTEMERQQVVAFATENRGNPFYNQRELERRKTEAMFGDDFAKAVLLPDEDPTEAAEQTRMQQLELLIIVGQASEVPVSPRDNHFVHLGVMAPAMESAASEAATNGAQGLEVLQALLAHAEAHFQYAAEAGGHEEELKKLEGFLKGVRTAVEKLNQLEQETHPAVAAAAAQAPVQPVQPEIPVAA